MIAVLTICISTCGLAVSQTPQWTVVQDVILTQQKDNLPEVTIFTPTTPGLYRLSEYLSVSGPPNSNAWDVVVKWQDVTGLHQSEQIGIGAGDSGKGVIQLGARIFAPKPGVPVTYYTFHGGDPPGSVYNFGIIIEQLR